MAVIITCIPAIVITGVHDQSLLLCSLIIQTSFVYRYAQVTFDAAEACIHIVDFGTYGGEFGLHFRPQSGQFGPNFIPKSLVGLIDESDDGDYEDAYGRYDLRAKSPVFAGHSGHLPTSW
ncbi:MAG: hypothetical protein F4207_09325 [Gemmatimonadetes bacterium]|nr:hypothetical protein [Gemmatimonadota bacterium]MYG16603.1 hypothetical protein [Gemmatimonadota bacterium]